jgi:hypothetical protein
MENLRMNQNEALEIKVTETEMKNVFNGIFQWLEKSEERINESDGILIVAFQTERQRKKISEREDPRTVRWLLKV